jgi:hypothetical protein
VVTVQRAVQALAGGSNSCRTPETHPARRIESAGGGTTEHSTGNYLKRAAGRIESAGGEEGARLSTLLATIRNVKLCSL